MSLSPGQAAILRALAEGAQIIAAFGSEDASLLSWDMYANITIDDCEALDGLGYLKYERTIMLGSVSTISTAGREALRALEQEAG